MSLLSPRRRFAVVATLLLGSCFSPKERDGTVRCGVAGSCPPSFACASDGLCYRSGGPAADGGVDSAIDSGGDGAIVIVDGGSDGAAIIDAAVIDGAVAIDAASPIDGASPIDAAVPDATVPDATTIDATAVECSDGIDNDCDGMTDFAGGDPGCASAADPSELGVKECDDGVDNDLDGFKDFHAIAGCGLTDPQCSGPNDNKENM